MGFHSWLQPKPQDCATMLRSKVRATKGIRALRKARERHFADAGRSGEPRRPGDRAQYLRIATWNLREFDSPSYGYRSAEAKAYIAEILSHFDLIALQEIRRDLDALDDHAAAPRSRLGLHRHRLDRRLVRNDERMAFLFDRNGVGFLGVAGELTLARGRRVTDPFGERFRVEDGPTLELPEAGRFARRPVSRRRCSSPARQSSKEDVEIDLPEGTRLV